MPDPKRRPGDLLLNRHFMSADEKRNEQVRSYIDVCTEYDRHNATVNRIP